MSTDKRIELIGGPYARAKVEMPPYFCGLDPQNLALLYKHCFAVYFIVGEIALFSGIQEELI